MVDDTRLISHARDKYTKSNVLIGAVYKSTLLENKVMAISLNRIDEAFEDKEGSLISTISTAELRRVLGVTGNGIYNYLDEIAKRMTGGRTLGFSNPEENSFMYVPLITKAEYKNGEFSIRYAPEMKQYLKEMKNQYTVLSLNTMLKFESVYSFRLYELLKSQCYYPKGVNRSDNDKYLVEMSLSELKLELGVVNGELAKIKSILMKTGENGKPDYDQAVEKAEEKMYKDYAKFRVKCLQVAVNEINEKTEMQIEFSAIRSGRGGKTTGIRFIVEVDEKKLAQIRSENNIQDSDVVDERKLDEDDFADLVRETVSAKIKTSEAKSIAKASNYNIEEIRMADEYVMNQDYEDYVAYMLTTIKNKYYEEKTPTKVVKEYKKPKNKTTSFNNFKQREYDYAELEKDVL